MGVGEESRDTRQRRQNLLAVQERPHLFFRAPTADELLLRSKRLGLANHHGSLGQHAALEQGMDDLGGRVHRRAVVGADHHCEKRKRLSGAQLSTPVGSSSTFAYGRVNTKWLETRTTIFMKGKLSANSTYHAV